MSIMSISSRGLRKAAEIKTQIERLEMDLQKVLNNGNGHFRRATVKRQMSAEGIARIAAAQRKRWATWRKGRK